MLHLFNKFLMTVFSFDPGVVATNVEVEFASTLQLFDIKGDTSLAAAGVFVARALCLTYKRFVSVKRMRTWTNFRIVSLMNLSDAIFDLLFPRLALFTQLYFHQSSRS